VQPFAGYSLACTQSQKDCSPLTFSNNGLANFRFHTLLFGINELRSDEMPYFGAKHPCSAVIVQLLCNQNFTVYPVDVRPSRAQTMKRLADFRPSDAPFGGLQIIQYTRVYCYLSPSAPRKRSTPISLPGDGHRAPQQNTNDPRAAAPQAHD
jgi:hypothetical protein